MKAILSVQFKDFHRGVLGIEHGVHDEVRRLTAQLKSLPQVRQITVLATHVHWVGLFPEDEATTLEQIRKMLDEIGGSSNVPSN